MQYMYCTTEDKEAKSMCRLLVYISGPLEADRERDTVDLVEQALSEAKVLFDLGLAVWCRHLNWRATGALPLWRLGAEEWLDFHLPFVERSDAMLMLPGWRDDRQARLEHDYALMLELPIFYSRQKLEAWAQGSTAKRRRARNAPT